MARSRSPAGRSPCLRAGARWRTPGSACGPAVAVRDDPETPFTQGFPCVKVNNYLDRVYSPHRVLHPLRRIGPKGEGRFERISWDTALDLIADRFRRIVAADGAEAILPDS